MDAAWDRLYPWTGLSEYVAVPRQGRICPLSAWAVDFLRASDTPCRTAGSAEATERFVGRRRRPEARYSIGMLGRLASTAFEPVRSTTGMPEGELVGRRSSCASLAKGEPKGAAPSIEQGPSGRLTERMCSLTYAGVAALRSEPRHPLASLVKNALERRVGDVLGRDRIRT